MAGNSAGEKGNHQPIDIAEKNNRQVMYKLGDSVIAKKMNAMKEV